MAATKVLLLYSALLVLALNWWQSESKTLSKEVSPDGSREKRFLVDPLSVMGLVVSVASAIQGVVCTFTDVCGSDEVSQKLEALETKLDAIESDVKSIKKDVEEIWEESKRKWYFDHIEYIVKMRADVILHLKNGINSTFASDTRQQFINEVLGGPGKDEYVVKALFHIPTLVTREQLLKHYFDVKVQNGESTYQAAKLTWKFIKKLFRYQEDGYASVVLAASMKYKNDKESYDQLMSQVCTWWSKSRDPDYKKFCAQFVKDPNSQYRRKIQEDYIFGWRDPHLFPVKQVQTDCSKHKDSDGLHYAAGYLFVSQPAASKILIVNRDNLDIVHTISLPGSECGGSCHPFDISIHAEHKVMAVAAHSQAKGGDSYVMMYNIKGDLTEPSGLTIEHYYTMFQLFEPEGSEPDVRSVAFCGNRFAYADYNGAIYNWRMRWGGSNPEPIVRERYDWYIDRTHNTIRGNIHYLGCSTSGTSWVVASTGAIRSDEGVGAVPADTSVPSVNVILSDIADIVVTAKSWVENVGDGRSRMNIVKGVAMDSKRNLFYSAVQWYGNSVSGIYQRTYDAKRRFIREWDHRDSSAPKVEIFDMAVDESGFLFVVQKDGSGGKCLHKYDHEIDLEDIHVN